MLEVSRPRGSNWCSSNRNLGVRLCVRCSSAKVSSPINCSSKVSILSNSSSLVHTSSSSNLPNNLHSSKVRTQPNSQALTLRNSLVPIQFSNKAQVHISSRVPYSSSSRSNTHSSRRLVSILRQASILSSNSNMLSHTNSNQCSISSSLEVQCSDPRLSCGHYNHSKLEDQCDTECNLLSKSYQCS